MARITSTASRLLLAALLAGGCGAGHEAAAVRTARKIDYSTSYAHMILRAGFDTNAQEEDAADTLLLEHVSRLDAADRDLAAHVECHTSKAPAEAATACVDTGHLLRTIEASAAAVVNALHPRPTHAAVRQAIADLPADLAALRTHLRAAQAN